MKGFFGLCRAMVQFLSKSETIIEKMFLDVSENIGCLGPDATRQDVISGTFFPCHVAVHGVFSLAAMRPVYASA